MIVSHVQEIRMERPPLPLDQVLSVIGLDGRLVGDDPAAPTHLRLGVGDRAVLWPTRAEPAEVEDETLAAIADMLANAAQLARTNRDLSAWARLHRLDPAAPRTHGAFQLALVLDDLAHRLLTPAVLHGLLESTDWHAYLHATPRPALPQEA
jgi:hypothetical protein